VSAVNGTFEGSKSTTVSTTTLSNVVQTYSGPTTTTFYPTITLGATSVYIHVRGNTTAQSCYRGVCGASYDYNQTTINFSSMSTIYVVPPTTVASSRSTVYYAINGGGVTSITSTGLRSGNVTYFYYGYAQLTWN